MSRLDNSLKNIKVGLFGQLFVVLTQYISRQALINFLPIRYVGYSGLFSNILLILSLAELGMGTAVVYCLYEPIAQKKYNEIVALLNKVKKIYFIISAIVLSCGLALLPFLNFFITDVPVDNEVRIIYILYLINTISSYCLAYRRSLYIADQKYSVINKVKYVCLGLECGLQALVVVVFKNYYLYMVVLITFTLLQNIVITIKANKEYAHILNCQPSDENPRISAKKLYKNIYAMAMHKLSSVIVKGTDNILISKFVGIATVGIYSNYLMIRTWLESAINTFFLGIVASIGNLSVTSSKEKTKDIFDVLFYMCGWFFSFCSICLYELYNPFISAWLGKSFLLDDTTRLIIVINFYISVMRQPIITMKNATGQFWNDRFIAIAEAVVNLVVSIALGKWFGIFGVLFGTTISTISTVFIAEPIIIYKNIFKISPLEYYKKYGEYVLYLLIVAVIVHASCSFDISNMWLDFIFKLLNCCLLSNAAFYVILRKKRQFVETKKILINVFRKVKKNI